MDEEVSRNSDSEIEEPVYESLFPIADIRKIPRAKLEEAPKAMNFFEDLNEGRFIELKKSIEKQGILHNLVVQELKNGNFMILSDIKEYAPVTSCLKKQRMPNIKSFHVKFMHKMPLVRKTPNE